MTGSSIAHYRITSKIGEGGMGAVYRAHDTKLGRDVAIKVLPPALANDADYIARFQREAQVLASLNHPNIAAIYGLEDNAIVMELVEGTELKGPLPVDEAVRIAKQIADALEAAHERGIIHRDLKPANIRITPDGTVKVLDFGLAKATEPANAASASVANSPTLTIHATTAGIILGTAAYMAPEQAAGKPVDRRADIWAFGVVLWEAVTGRQLFGSETVSHTLASVLKDAIDLTAIPAGPLRNLIGRCLERAPRKRLGWIGEAHAILDVREPAVAQAVPRWWFAALAALIPLTALATWFLRPVPASPDVPPRRSSFAATIPEPNQQSFSPPCSISPDGKHIVFGGADKLYIRSLDSEELRPIEQTERGHSAFWSPDSQWIGFIVEREIRKVRVSGGAPVTLYTHPSILLPVGITWHPDGSVVLASFAGSGGLLEIPARGGTPKLLPNVRGNFNASIAAEAPHIMFSRRPGTAGRGIIAWNSKTREEIDLGVQGLGPVYSEGHILYTTRGSGSSEPSLWALPISRDTWKSSGEPFQVARSAQYATVAADGTLTWLEYRQVHRRLVRRDLSGRLLGTAGQPQVEIRTPDVSPDGTRVAVGGSDGWDSRIWIHDLNRPLMTRLPSSGGVDARPHWSPDGRSIAFVGAGNKLLIGPVDGSSPPIEILPQLGRPSLSDWTREGSLLATLRNIDVAVVTRGADGKWQYEPVLATNAAEREAVLSPDGRFIAYESDEDGRSEVFIRAFPTGGNRIRVSQHEGRAPKWSPDGSQLFYVERGALMSVPFRSEPASVGTPVRLFSGVNQDYAVMPNGREFVIAEPVSSEPAGQARIHVMDRWLQSSRRDSR